MTYVVTLQSACALAHVASPAEKSRGWRVLRMLEGNPR